VKAGYLVMVDVGLWFLSFSLELDL
jgi:hypothetical protein